MTSADAVALVLVLAIAAYACGGGIDYGAGFWDLTAGGDERGARPRALVDYAMAPVWEANNVWLVFVLILTWTGFPTVFESVISTAWLAVILAGLGLVLRGAGFALRKPTRQRIRRRRYTAVFGGASILAPFFFATVLGGVASVDPVGNRAGDPVTSWLNPPAVHDQAARHPHHHAGVAVPDADLAGARVAARRRDRDPRRGPRRRRHQARRAPGASAWSASTRCSTGRRSASGCRPRCARSRRSRVPRRRRAGRRSCSRRAARRSTCRWSCRSRT